MWEVLLTVVVALLVLGPKQLPAVARTAGRLLQRGQNFLDSLKSEMQQQMQLDSLQRNETKAKLADAQYQNPENKISQPSEKN